MLENLKLNWDTHKQWWGCSKSKIRLHNYQWSLGPEVDARWEHGMLVQESYLGGPGMWWMYCTKCGRKVWDDETTKV